MRQVTPETTSETVPYQVEFLGTEDSALLSILEAASQLIFNIALSNEETDAFDARSASASAAIDSRYLEDW